jgi:catechol O-methyltransferase
MRGNPTEVLKHMDLFTETHKFLMNIGPEKGSTIADIISTEKPKVFVELGAYLGYSAILCAQEMRKYQTPGTTMHYWSLEFNADFANIAIKMINLAGLSDIVHVVTGPADASLKALQELGELSKIDMLLLDHDEQRYTVDFKLCEELGLFKAGSTIIADNIIRPGAPEYREFVRAHSGLHTRGVRGLIMPGSYEVSLTQFGVIYYPATTANKSLIRTRWRLAPLSRSFKQGNMWQGACFETV